MKKKILALTKADKMVISILTAVIIIAAAAALASCSTDDPEDGRVNVSVGAEPEAEPATITFQCRGFDLRTEPFATRAELKADGKAMTDLWVLDYMNGSLAQSAVHQTSDQDDFGTPTLNLAVGSHHVYFIASRGTGASLSTADHTIAFGKVLDTFYYDYAINVTASSNGTRTVTLDRVVTKFTATIQDAIPTGAATFNMTPARWYYSFDYVSGNPTTATENQTVTIDIPSSEIGVTNEKINIYGFSAADEWTTDITVNCKTSGSAVLGSASITNVPLKRNRVTVFSGPLFSAEGLTTVSLSTAWDTEHTGTW